LWAYCTHKTARVKYAPGTLNGYRWNDETIEFCHCNACGCMTHYKSTGKINTERIAVNMRMAPPKAIEGIRVRTFDGADTWKFIDARPAGAEAVSAPSHILHLDLLPERLAVCRLDARAGVPDWIGVSAFYSVTRTPAELSIVCEEDVLPGAVKAQRGWRGLMVRGPLNFDETGILDSLARPLAAAGISIFAVSTFDTDYLLVPANCLALVTEVLSAAGHRIDRPGV